MPKQARRLRRLTSLGALIACFLPGARADAAAVWPTGTWQGLTVGGGVYTDAVGDEHPDATDMVGGNDGSGDYTAGYWAQSETDDQLSLRMRIDADGSGTNSVWQFLFDTDGDATSIDWVLEVRQSGSPSSRQVIFTQTTTDGPAFNDIALSSSFAWTGPLADWTRWTGVTDGSNFDGDADYFLDVAIPLSVFRSLTGLAATDSFGLGLASSTSHTQVNKDLPLDLEPTDLVSGGFADPIPEPGTAVLTGLGLCWLGVRARNRSYSSSQRSHHCITTSSAASPRSWPASG